MGQDQDQKKDCGKVANMEKFVNGWIDVKQEPPKSNERLLFFNGKKEVTFGYAYPPEEGWNTGIEGLIWINDFERETNEVASHWMPLPLPPDSDEYKAQKFVDRVVQNLD